MKGRTGDTDRHFLTGRSPGQKNQPGNWGAWKLPKCHCLLPLKDECGQIGHWSSLCWAQLIVLVHFQILSGTNLQINSIHISTCCKLVARSIHFPKQCEIQKSYRTKNILSGIQHLFTILEYCAPKYNHVNSFLYRSENYWWNRMYFRDAEIKSIHLWRDFFNHNK